MLNATEIICFFSFDGGETYALRWCYNWTHRHPHGCSTATHYEFVLFFAKRSSRLDLCRNDGRGEYFSIRARTGICMPEDRGGRSTIFPLPFAITLSAADD